MFYNIDFIIIMWQGQEIRRRLPLIVCYSQSPIREDTPYHRGHMGSSTLGQKGELGVRRKHGQEPLLWFPWEGKRGLGMATLNYFSRLWGIEAVLSCLVPGHGVIKAEGEWPGV